MSLHLSKSAIRRKSMQVSALIFLSRVLGITREALSVRFFGVGALSDAFIVAFRIPNFFRHIFAEGALSASFVPVMVKTVKDDNRHEANGLMTLSFLFFEGIVLALYALVLWKTELVVRILAPGFSPEQMTYAIPFLQILFSFIVFCSSTALLAGALQAVNNFAVPAFGAPFLNMFWIATLCLCLYYRLSPVYLCLGIIVGAVAQFLMHLYSYFKHGFTFGAIDHGSKAAFKSVLAKFLPCLFGVSIFELNLVISGMIASYLPKGSVSLLHYGARFLSIPLGILAIPLSSVLLPHFSRLALYAPRRLNFYLLEAAKMVTWAIMPAMTFLMLVSNKLFEMMLAGKATPEQISEGGMILMLYLLGLLFLCLNKILLSMLYALKDTKSTTIAAAGSATINIIGDLIGGYFFGTYGIAFANSLAALTMTVQLLYFLDRKHSISFYATRYLRFLSKYAIHFLGVAAVFYVFFSFFLSFLHNQRMIWVMSGVYFWVVAGAFGAMALAFLFSTRRRAGVDVYFLRK